MTESRCCNGINWTEFCHSSSNNICGYRLWGINWSAMTHRFHRLLQFGVFFSEFFAWPECMCAAHVQYSGMFFVVRSKWSKSLMADALFMLSAHSSRVTFWHIHFIWKSHVQCARVIYATKQMCRNSQVVKHPDICVRRPNRCVTQLIRWTDPTHVCHNNHYGKKYAISIFEDQTLTLELFNRAWAECFCWIGDNVLTVWRIG